MLPLVAGLMVIGTTAGAQQDTTRRPTMPPPTTGMGQPQQQGGDQKVIGAAIASNEAEVALAELALTKTQNEQVREYALTLRRDHTELLEKLRRMSGQANAAAPDDPDVREITRNGDDQEGMLQRLDTAAFDSLFIEQMVNNHQKMLTTIDTKWLPNAQGELRSTLESAKPKVQEHLRQAEALKNRKRGMPEPTMRRDTSAVPVVTVIRP
jgi:putative membrane protein